MREQPLGLDIGAGPSESPEPWQWQRAMWPAVGVVVLAATAVVVGHLQRPAPVPPPALETIVVPGGAIGSSRTGSHVLLWVSIRNAGSNPVMLTDPEAESGAGTDVLDVRVALGLGSYPMDGAWPPAQSVAIGPGVSAFVAIRFRVDCRVANAQLPLLPAIIVTVSAGRKRSIANITPDEQTMIAIGVNAEQQCH